MQSLKNYLPILAIAIAYLGLYILENQGVITSAQREAIMFALGIGAPAITLHMPQPQKAPPSGAAALLLVALCVPVTGCTPAERAGIPVLSTIDAVGMGLSRVAGWCSDAGADDATFERAKQATRDKDYSQAIALLSEVATSLRATGHDVPDDAFVTLKLIEGALAASAVEQGMRALSTPSAPASTVAPHN